MKPLFFLEIRKRFFGGMLPNRKGPVR